MELNSPDGEDGTPPDDYFRDARRQTPAHVDDRISAIYELGITTGTNGMVGEKGTYNPNGLVTRAQMASFIMRTMGHTNLRPAGLTAQSTDDDTQVSMRDADFGPIGDVRTEVFTTNFPDDAFNANGGCIGRFISRQDPSFEACEIDHGDRLTDGDSGNALWEGVGLKRGNQLIILCSSPTGPTIGEPAEDSEYEFMAGTRGSDTDYTIYAWSSAVGDEATSDDLFESVPANVLTELTEAEKFVVTGDGSGMAVDGVHPGLHFKMGQTVTFTVQLVDEDGDPVGPTPGVNNYFEVREDTFRETAETSQQIAAATDRGNPVDASSLSPGFTGEVYQGSVPIVPDPLPTINDDDGNPLPAAEVRRQLRVRDPERLYARDDVVDTNAEFPTGDGGLMSGDYTRTRKVREPDSSGQFTVTIVYPDPTRLINNADALKRVTITPVRGNALEAREMTMPMDQAVIDPTTNSVQLPDVRFSDNDPLATSLEATANAYRVRSTLRNRNSLSVSVLDQYGVRYRGGEYEIVATDLDHDGQDAGQALDPDTEGIDFPAPFAVSTSGRRSLGYTHTGQSPERQDVDLVLWLSEVQVRRGVATADVEDDSSTPYVNEASVAANEDDPSTRYVDEANDIEDDAETTDVNELESRGLVEVDEALAVMTAVAADDPVTVLWASVAAGPLARGQETMGLPILIGDAGANFIVVDSDGVVDGGDDPNNLEAVPVAYPFGPDDNFVVEGASVTMDQFEEILAQHDPTYENGGLIESLGMLSWAGYDFSRPRDGATWTITGLSCREPGSGD